METLVRGDIVKVKPEYLESYEDPDTLYYVAENNDGRVKVYLPDENIFTGYHTFVWPDYTFYKVGHTDMPEDK